MKSETTQLTNFKAEKFENNLKIANSAIHNIWNIQRFIEHLSLSLSFSMQLFCQLFSSDNFFFDHYIFNLLTKRRIFFASEQLFFGKIILKTLSLKMLLENISRHHKDYRYYVGWSIVFFSIWQHLMDTSDSFFLFF